MAANAVPQSAGAVASTVSVQMSALKQAHEDTDSLPFAVDPAALGTTGLVASSTRLVGQTEGASFWAATDKDGSVCLVIAFTAEAGFATSSCSAPEEFARQGISTQSGSTDYVAEAYLVPDAALGSLPNLDAIEGSTSPNLIIGNPEVSSDRTESRATSGDFPITVFSEPLDLGW